MNRGGEKRIREIMSKDILPVAFIGSGVSTNFGDWSIFLKNLVGFANSNSFSGEQLSIDDDTSLDIQLHIADDARRIIKGNTNDDERFCSYMNSIYERNGKQLIPPVFESIIRAPFAFYITTNYDRNIEDAYFKNHGIPLKVFTPSVIGKALKHMYNEPQEPFLLKLHGSVESSTNDEFIVGHDDYRKIIYNNKHLRYVLASIFATRSIVFIGYGHRDPHITRYLEYELSVLPEISSRHFAFSKKQSSPDYSPLRSYLNRLKIENIELTDWGQISTILDQCTFLRLRDHYQRGKQQYKKSYDDVITNANKDSVQGALMYVYISSELGHNEDIEELWNTLEKNLLLKNYINETPTYDLLLRIVAGQMFKRTCRYQQAENEFEKVQALALNTLDNEIILNPLKALGLRYAGIFYYHTSQNIGKAIELFTKARDVLGEDFEEESFDIEKWQIIVSGEDVFKRLLDLASRSEKKYKKNAAWCRYGAVEYIYENNPKLFDKTRLKEYYAILDTVLLTFEELQHTIGAGKTHWLYAEILYRKETDTMNKEKIQKHFIAAYAMASLCRDMRLIKKCNALQKDLNIFI